MKHTGKTKTTQQHNDQNNFYYHIYKQTYFFNQLIYMYVSSTNVGNFNEYWQRHCIAIRNWKEQMSFLLMVEAFLVVGILVVVIRKYR